MANKVTLLNVPPTNFDVRLVNGDLIVIRDEAYLVSSYIGPSDKRANEYCALVHIKSGAKAFTEPCSRRTNLKRVTAHFQHRHMDLRTFEVLHVPKDKYSIDIKIQGGEF